MSQALGDDAVSAFAVDFVIAAALQKILFGDPLV
jgi:hypothetical protein